MEIQQLLREGREIWGEQKLTVDQVIVRLGKCFGDICRWQRNEAGDKDTHTDAELKKELGNILFSTIRWCDDLGYDPEECIQLAKEAQRKYKSKLIAHSESQK